MSDGRDDALIIVASRAASIEENGRALDHTDFSAEELATIDPLTGVPA